jgi:integrase
MEAVIETFESFADRWKQTILPMKKPASVATLSSHLRLLSSKIGPRPLPDLAYTEVQQVFTALAETHSPRSCRNIFGAYRIVCSQAKRERLIEKFPVPVLPKLKKTKQDWLSLVQMSQIIKACDEKYRPFACLLAESGVRIGEALGLMVSDLDGQTLRIERSIWGGLEGLPKTDNALRKFYVSKHLAEMLRGSSSRGKYFFQTRAGTPWWPTEVRKYLDPVMIGLGIPPMGFHSWRRGNITALASTMGVPTKIISTRVGHAAEGLTLGVYCQNIDGADKPYIDKYAEALYA